MTVVLNFISNVTLFDALENWSTTMIRTFRNISLVLASNHQTKMNVNFKMVHNKIGEKIHSDLTQDNFVSSFDSELTIMNLSNEPMSELKQNSD